MANSIAMNIGAKIQKVYQVKVEGIPWVNYSGISPPFRGERQFPLRFYTTTILAPAARQWHQPYPEKHLVEYRTLHSPEPIYLPEYRKLIKTIIICGLENILILQIMIQSKGI